VFNEGIHNYLPELGEDELLTPDLSLASETVDTDGGETNGSK
jgi:hypothetical protein